ncbi:MAG: aminomethyl-transferring glycine dehydrogenase [Deltaproteobacteria bacterium HGW-Deltaproteobacteria-22]|nr:MAG: aminomethyl-transferring glycine dehydrogenase [Deltaproteobacteria bacterium HGW-Deltaproteobacteria-22]
MRYLPHSPQDIQHMLKTIGVEDVEELFRSIPRDQRTEKPDESPGLPECQLRRYIEGLSSKNKVFCVMLASAGAPFHAVPKAVETIIGRSEFQTAYTPYQPEVSQGTLQAVFEFQTIVTELMGLDVSNASLYDGASAVGEALLLALRVHKGKRRSVWVSEGLHPHAQTVIRTMLHAFGEVEIRWLPLDGKTGATLLPGPVTSDVAAVAVGYPNFLGVVEDVAAVAGAARQGGALSIVSVSDPSHLAVLASPGQLGVDIAVGEGMGISGTGGMGGPGLGLMAVRDEYVKQMPGRIVGQTVDSRGNPGYVLTLATREQHIRREKATSNICSNQALVALAFTVHMSLLGPAGLKDMAVLSRNRAMELRRGLLGIPGVRELVSGPVMNEFALVFPKNAEGLRSHMADNGIFFGVPLGRFYPGKPEYKDAILLSATETACRDDIAHAILLAKEFYREGK